MSGGKKRSRGCLLRWGLPVVYVALAGILWVLLPTPFAHGLILGAFLAPVVVLGGFLPVARRMARRFEDRLGPPALPTYVRTWAGGGAAGLTTGILLFDQQRRCP